MKIRVFAIGLASILVAGCGRKQAQTAEELQAAFQTPANNAALSQAKPEVKAWVDQAVTAMKNDDQATAVMSLRSLRSSGQLTVEQSHVVEGLMNKARGDLIARAMKGDQQAAAAVQMLNQNPPR
jgi:hypothetical protein